MNEQRNWDVYPGKKKHYNWLTFLVGVAVVVVAVVILLFSSFQKYLVYRQDGVHLDLPYIESSYEAPEDLEGITREPVQAELVLDDRGKAVDPLPHVRIIREDPDARIFVKIEVPKH